MKDFWYYVPTRVNFGPSCFQYLVDTIHQWGTKPLIVYGGGSIKRNGVYDEIMGILNAQGKCVVEFTGIMSKPTYVKVQDGAKLRGRPPWQRTAC